MVKRIEQTDNEATFDMAGADLQPLPMAPMAQPRTISIGVFRINGSVEYPTYETDSAGCFSVAADLSSHNAYLVCRDAVLNRDGLKKVRDDFTGRHVLIEPGERIMIPTGLVLDIPAGFSLNMFIQNSMAFERGLGLANGVDYIDEGSNNELLIPIINNSNAQVRLTDYELLAKIEIRASIQATIEILDKRPQVK